MAPKKMIETLTKTIRILFLEDDQDFGPAIIRRLTKEAFEVVQAITAEEALDLLNSNDFDVVIADIRLPGMDGIDFLQEIRNRRDNTPVVILTGYGSAESAQRAVNLKAWSFLTKPLDTIECLLDPICEAVNTQRLQKEKECLLSKLQQQNNLLLQQNETLAEMRKQIERQKARVEEDVFINVEKMFLPVIRKLKLNATTIEQSYLDMLETNLKEMTSSFTRRLSEKYLTMTPREIEVCNMIKSGLSTEEISKLLNLENATIERHRNNIRGKLGIIKTGKNLRTFLHEL